MSTKIDGWGGLLRAIARNVVWCCMLITASSCGGVDEAGNVQERSAGNSSVANEDEEAVEETVRKAVDSYMQQPWSGSSAGLNDRLEAGVKLAEKYGAFSFVSEELLKFSEQQLLSNLMPLEEDGFGQYQEALRDSGEWERGTWKRQTETTLAFLPISGSSDVTRIAIQYTVQPREIESERLIKEFNGATEKLKASGAWKRQENWQEFVDACKSYQAELEDYRKAGGLMEWHKSLSFERQVDWAQEVCDSWSSIEDLMAALEE